MKSITYVNFPMECTELSSGWTKVDQFKSKNTTVDHNKVKYEIISKATNQASLLKRIAYIALSILTLGLPLCFASIRNTVFKGKESVHFAVPYCDADHSKKMDDLMNKVWTPKGMPTDSLKPASKAVAEKSMWENAAKAIKEHSEDEGYAYFTGDKPAEAGIFNSFANRVFEQFLPYNHYFKDLLPNLEDLKSTMTKPLTLSHTDAAAQGYHRKTMEDAHFYKDISQGTLSGVFDGHGGKEIAEYASKAFEKSFEQTLKDTNGDVHAAFESLFSQIQHEVAKCRPLYHMGSTAVVTFIDKQSNIIYTATLGDSEANIYRKIDGKMKSIPLSCVRDWSSPRDAARAAKALNDPSIATEWPKLKGQKPRFPSPAVGVNVARAFGDIQVGHLMNGSGMIHKPKITMNKLEHGDVVLLACDGLKDYVAEKVIVEKVAALKDTPATNLAKELVNYAIDPKGADAQDNVTVVAIKA